ncbi:MAG: pyridoxine 5'-phosphate synthase [Robiginitomaculum sp.]
MIRLGINIDHVATLRNARGGAHPDPVEAAKVAIDVGASGITAHLREDRRHIRDADIIALQALCEARGVPLNMEIAATAEMLSIALATKPHAVCMVPERREERTTEGGLDVAGLHNTVAPMVAALQENGSRVSLFIEASSRQIRAAAQCKADIIEIHAGAYAHALDGGNGELAAQILQAMEEGAELAASLGLEVHAGHGLTFDNVAPIAAIPQVVELNIGHYIMGEAMFMGLGPAIKKMADIIRAARTGIEDGE